MAAKHLPQAEFRLDPLKTVLQTAMVAGVFVLAGWPLIDPEARDGDSLTAMIMLLVIGLYMGYLLVRDLLAGNPVIAVAPEGLIDRRGTPAVLPWTEIVEIEVRRLTFMPGLRVRLRNGERREIDTMLLNAKAAKILEAARPHLLASEKNG
ncbi:MAG: hypothetical protein WDZ84_04750 [Rhodovibrionaceae bacterium]